MKTKTKSWGVGSNAFPKKLVEIAEFLNLLNS